MLVTETDVRMSPWKRHPLALAAVLVFAVALGVRFTYSMQVRGTALERWHRMDQTDMATYLCQAQQFASGDWLASAPYHPYHAWQGVAPPQKWLEWYGPHTFHQAPGYAWLLAVAQRAGADPALLAVRLQLALGAATAVVTLLLARELAGLYAGIAAGLLAALYGPLVQLEAQVLREGPALCFQIAILLGLVRYLRVQPGERGWLAPALLGAAVGAFHVFHEMGTILLAAVAIAIGVHAGRAGWKRASIALAAVASGYLLGFAPLLARNVAVGAPPFSVSCRTVINFAQANEADAPDGGSTFSIPGPNVVRILDRAQGSLLAALGPVWETYRGDFGRVLSGWSARFASIWKWPEEADNTSFDFYRARVAVLRWLPTFAFVFPLGFAGALAVIAGAFSARRRGGAPQGLFAAAWSARRAAHLALFLHLGLLALALSLVHVVGRFRLYAVPFFWVYAGVLVVLLVRSLRAKRTGAAAALLALAVLGALLQRAFTRESERDLHRLSDFATAAFLAVDAGDYAAARQFVEQGMASPARNPLLYVSLGENLERRGERAGALDAYQRALELDPHSARAREGLTRLQKVRRP